MGTIIIPVIYEKVVKEQIVIEIVRPDGSGDTNDIEHEVGVVAPNHYLNVDEIVADDAITTVYEDAGVMHYDLYTLDDTIMDYTISKIVIHGRFMADNANFLALHEPEFILKSGGITKTYNIPNFANMQNGIWFSDKLELLVNPVTLATWTKAELDALQIGCGLIRCRFSSLNKEYCTQLYVKVYYTYQP